MRPIAFTAVALAAASFAAQAQSTGSVDARLQELDQQIRILERKLEIDNEAAAARTAATAAGPVIKADGGGLSISTPAFSFQFRGLVQADGRWFTGNSVPQDADTLLLRRLRPTFQGNVGSLASYRLTPEFAGNNATIVDAWIDLKLGATSLRAGKQKGPIGLERLQSGAAIHFIERGLPTELAPNREIGAQLQGAVAGNTLQWVVGVYNGTTDGADAGATDNDGRKEVALRLFYEPTPGVGFGVAGTHGSKRGGAPRNYATVDRRGGTSFTQGTVYNGDTTRLSPQGYVYRGPIGLLGEYIQSRQTLSNATSGAVEETVTHSAWQVVASYVLTGENASYRGVRPSQNFEVGKPGWGAFEVAARYGALDLDSDAAALGFVAATGVESIENLGIGLNWYLNGNVKVAANYNQTDFSNFSGADREKEKSFFTRLQLAF